MSKAERQRELRRLHPEQYRAYDRKPKRTFSKTVDCARRKIVAIKMIGQFKCMICGESDLIKLTIDHVDESGSESNLYMNLLSGRATKDMKQILCYSCNSALRVIGHDDMEKRNAYVSVYNEARNRSIERGEIGADELPPMTDWIALRIAGLLPEQGLEAGAGI